MSSPTWREVKTFLWERGFTLRELSVSLTNSWAEVEFQVLSTNDLEFPKHSAYAASVELRKRWPGDLFIFGWDDVLQVRTALEQGENNSGWVKEWPTEPGEYWFYGDPNGNVMTEKTDKRQLILVRAARSSNDGLVLVGNRQFINKAECGVYVRWMPATLPALPEGE